MILLGANRSKCCLIAKAFVWQAIVKLDLKIFLIFTTEQHYGSGRFD